ncbi:MAG: pilus assembly protein N-terminal domain-containing protein [Acidobacteriaceae bacterium]|nr:pilus assembly protein N-terminal domain-containing protein [Acidobacteriaceae bacterium]
MKAQGLPNGAVAAQDPSNELFVVAGKSVIVDSALPIERISVGFGDVAEATAVSPQEILVNGKTPGETSLIVWQRGGSKLFFDVKVAPAGFAAESRLDALKRQLAKELPNQKIDASVEGDLVFLRGTVKDLTSSDRAMAIAGAIGKPVNLLYVDVPAPEPQILLKVRFASVDRSLSTQAGINIFSTGATNTIGSISTQQFSPPLLSSSGGSGGGGGSGSGGGSGGGSGVGSKGVTATLTDALNLFFFRPDLNLGATIEALEAKGLVEVLAEPNVLAENGKQASFLAGGQFPYPVVQGAGAGGANAVTIQFQQFGVRLNFIPTITPRGTIHLQVAPEVSALDYASGVTVEGFTVPGISVRRVHTEVELSEGQSFAIGGLLDNRETQTLSKIPFIGDIPILGKLFQSISRSKNNTELMVIVTPQFVRPIPAGQPIPELKYPVPFLPANTPAEMATPGQKTTGPVPVTPPPPTVPVETLIKSLQAEKPLIINSGSGNGGSQGQAAGTGTGPPTGYQ